ncbi:MAG: right-handed parallel beta-helix repeat-containing protein, partial [Pirellulaceae bacterium]
LGPDDQVLADAEFTTWTEDVPVAKTIRLESRIVPGRPLRIDPGGSPDGWVRYDGGGGLAVDAQQSAVAAVTIENAPYVLLDEVTVRGGQRHGIHVVDSHHVRIRRCDIAGFGRVGRQDLTKDGKYYDEQGRAINNDAGVCIERSGQVVVERCYIHDPRNHANSWFYSHPAGPNAIYLRNVPGQLVVRYNDLVGSNLHRWNDVIEASGNGEVDGGFHCDSDIYGNYLAFANDDAIELDGGQCNVRFYGNHCEGTLCGVSTAANRRGPSYVIGNVICELGDERGRAGAGTKNGGGTTYSQGTTFFYHNTFFTAGDGIAAVGFGNDRNRGMFLGVSRNNVFAVSGDGIRDPYAPAPCDYDYDLFATPWESSGTLAVGRAVESHALATAARFVDAASGIFRPRPDSPARGTGVQLAGMSVFQSGNAVDRGALSVSGSTDRFRGGPRWCACIPRGWPSEALAPNSWRRRAR